MAVFILFFFFLASARLPRHATSDLPILLETYSLRLPRRGTGDVAEGRVVGILLIHVGAREGGPCSLRPAEFETFSARRQARRPAPARY